MKEILTQISSLRQFKILLQITIMYKKDFDMVFHFKASQNLVAEHYDRHIDMIFPFKVAQIFVAN